jgi:membrane-associated phospholipid phosphatase
MGRKAWDHFSDAGRFVLVAGAIAAPLVNRRDLRGSFNALTSILAVAALSKAIKAFWREPRPNGENNNSFPSQHSSECFAAATALERELGQPVGPAAFALAGAVSYARIVCGKHHPVDVVAGAGMGITAANLTCGPGGRQDETDAHRRS